MKGLLIKAYWGHKILKGEKTWEIRGTNTSHRGHTEIIYSGTGERIGSANLVDAIPITRVMLEASFEFHRIDPKKYDIIPYKRLYAWIFENAAKHETPIPYNHPHGAVIWVNLSDSEATESA